MTPLEAAIARGDLATVTLLREHGARIDEATATTLVCLARVGHEQAIEEYLAGIPIALNEVRCDEPTLPRED